MPSVEDARRYTDGPFGPLIESRLRTVTWNLWWRFGPWEERQPAIVETLRAVDADVIGLQEVWDDGVTNQAATIASELGYHYTYGALLELDGIKFGNAVLSRWPIERHEVHPLTGAEGADEMRCIVFAEVAGPRGHVQVFTTHLNWRFDHSDIRQRQVRTLCELVARTKPRTYPPILLGDFNAEPTSDEIRMITGRAPVAVDGLVFHDAWDHAGAGAGHTWSNDNPYAALELEPNRRIDYVFTGWPKAGGAGNAVAARLVGTEAVGGVQPSDHYGVLAELRY